VKLAPGSTALATNRYPSTPIPVTPVWRPLCSANGDVIDDKHAIANVEKQAPHEPASGRLLLGESASQLLPDNARIRTIAMSRSRRARRAGRAR
jgi:hypothetical protein